MSHRYLGLDPGSRRIGIAVSDTTGTIATPLRFVLADGNVVDEIRSICEEYDIDGIVVGLPISLDGTEGPSATAAREFGAMIHDELEVPVYYQDERFTSHTAESALIAGGVRRRDRKTKRDQVAAAVMLQSWLDRRRIDGE